MAILKLPDREIVIDAVGFDVDGPLRETGEMAYNNCRSVIAELGGVPPDFESFVHDWGGLLKAYFRSCGVVASDEKIERVNSKYVFGHDLVEPSHDVEDALKHLESLGVRTFALSGHRHQELEAWFKQHGLHTRFDHIQGNGGNKLDHLIALRERFSTPPARACYIGDWGLDMRAAVQADLIPIGITRRQPTKAVLERNGAALVIDHLCEFTALLS